MCPVQSPDADLPRNPSRPRPAFRSTDGPNLSSTMICRTSRMHRDPKGVVIVTVDMSISCALHFCLSISRLISMFSMMGSGNALTLRGKPRFLAFSTALPCIAEYSEPVSANTVTLTQRFSAVRYAVWQSLLSAVALLLPKFLKFAFFLSASPFFLSSDNRTIASSFTVCAQSDK
jgi:hypothetical protein